ncbi:hypothetical protein L596_019276 [Steinernema carpocapsae]|uniref:Uncharacterized protein n=1 Tax=Steinernema carpocapsae TaxID=34508 RepID=A0A4U5MPZ2_STECR|nr:hypothetical protein L596_019276 [Steinernema carpocapsae]
MRLNSFGRFHTPVRCSESLSSQHSSSPKIANSTQEFSANSELPYPAKENGEMEPKWDSKPRSSVPSNAVIVIIVVLLPMVFMIGVVLGLFAHDMHVRRDKVAAALLVPV